MNVIDLLKQDGFRVVRAASTNGGEYSSACPWCGGSDRFRVWSEQDRDKGGKYWCRQCGKSGDGIQYLRDKRGMGYREACELLQVMPRERDHQTSNVIPFPVRNDKPYEPKPYIEPGEVWKQRAEILICNTQKILYGDAGKAALTWLHERGLTDQTIRSMGLGYIPEPEFNDYEVWGMTAELNDKGNKKKVWLPKGVTIPTYSTHDGYAVRLRIRRPNHELKPDDSKYVIVRGSGNMAMNLSNQYNRKRLLIVESELCGLLVWQCAGDMMVGVIALGSVSHNPDSETHNLFCNADLILNALDYDAPGAKARQKWIDLYGDKVKRLPPIRGKDPTESFQHGVNLRKWIETGFRKYGVGNG